MKGIILAGGNGTRLRPATISVSKQLLPIYNKPLIYYPLSVLMLSRITDILIITRPSDTPQFQNLLGDGSHLGLRIDYAQQPTPRGLADAFIVGAEHVGLDSVALILGDNIFHGASLPLLLRREMHSVEGCVLFGYPVPDPERYGVGETDAAGNLLSLEEKPSKPRSNRAITGLYLYDNTVVELARGLTPSLRGELEITDINRIYLDAGLARLVDLGGEFAWFDTGTHDALLDASVYVRGLEEQKALIAGSIEIVALETGLIDAQQCFRLGQRLSGTAYGQHVMDRARAAGFITGSSA